MGKIAHLRAKRRLDAFIDNELVEHRRAEVQDHLDECPDCSAHVRLLLAMRRSLRRLASPDEATVRRLQQSGPAPGS